MSLYKNILVAVDLSDDSTLVLEKARDIAERHGAELNLVHVIEPIAIGYAVEVSSIDIEGLHAEASRQARTQLLELGRSLGLAENRLHSLLGQPAREIRELAKNLGADLIIMGGHGRRGWELLFGSTATDVSHGVKCDLLVVHLES